jgi:2,4-dienoyl-CoA reductase (NADPH2)
MAGDIIFEPLVFRNLKVKNRIFRSNISGRFDNYDGSGSYVRINWEERFARGGVGAIVSSFVPVNVAGRILPNYATIDADDKIPFWRELGKRIHGHECRYILQLSHSGRQQDIPGIENMFRKPWSATDRIERLNGFLPQMMTREQIRQTVVEFGNGARRAREAGLDGVETHSANGYLFTQFLSSGINNRKDEYGGALENRARFLMEVVAEIRKQVGRDYHLQCKINGADYGNAVLPWEGKGNTIEDAIQLARWLEEAGVDAIHVSAGSSFPHPFNPPGRGFPHDWAMRTIDIMLSSGVYVFQRYLAFRYRPLRPLFNLFWNRNKPAIVEGINAENARRIREHVKIPVICTGGFQTASHIRRYIGEGFCDAVSIARGLVANPDLVKIWASGKDLPDRPCTHCNKCLVNAIKNPLGCYELSRFDGDHDRMVKEILSVYHPSPYDPIAIPATEGK